MNQAAGAKDFIAGMRTAPISESAEILQEARPPQCAVQMLRADP
jgi:hypothetical protein